MCVREIYVMHVCLCLNAVICHDVFSDQKTALIGKDPPICHVRQNFLFTALYARLSWSHAFVDSPIHAPIFHAPIIKDIG